MSKQAIGIPYTTYKADHTYTRTTVTPKVIECESMKVYVLGKLEVFHKIKGESDLIPLDNYDRYFYKYGFLTIEEAHQHAVSVCKCIIDQSLKYNNIHLTLEYKPE